MILEHDGAHVLMSDVADGKIYRVNVATQDVEMIYDHPYGVNTIYRDKRGRFGFPNPQRVLIWAKCFRLPIYRYQLVQFLEWPI